MATNKENQSFGRFKGFSFPTLAIIGCFLSFLAKESSAFIVPTYQVTTPYPGATGYGGPAIIYYNETTDKLFVGGRTGRTYTTVKGGVKNLFAGDNSIAWTVANGGVAGPATSAIFRDAYGVWGDSLGNVYVGDHAGHRVRKVTPNGQIANFAGTGVASSAGDGGPGTSAGVNLPVAIAGDKNGNIRITEFGGNRIRLVSASTGLISTIVGTGVAGTSINGAPATSVLMTAPFGFIYNTKGDLYFGQWGDNTIRWVSPANNRVYNLGGNGAALTTFTGGLTINAKFNWPTSMWQDPVGNVFFAEYNGNRVNVLSRESNYTMVYRVSNVTLATTYGLYGDSAGNRLFVSSESENLVRVFNQINLPSAKPTAAPSRLPTALPTRVPSSVPTITPSVIPSVSPSATPSAIPSAEPSQTPSVTPSVEPSVTPSVIPSVEPSVTPSESPSVKPSTSPSVTPSVEPSHSPSETPSVEPSQTPSALPSTTPSTEPSNSPTEPPTTLRPTWSPTVAPTKGSCPTGDCCQWRSARTTVTNYGPDGEELSKVVTLVEYL